LGLAGALKEFWYLRSYFQEGAQWLSAALAHHPAAPDAQSRRRRAKALLANAQMTQHLGNYAQALQLVEESIALYRTAADQWGVAEGLRESGWILLGLGQRQAALDRFTASLEAFRAVDDPAKIAAVLTSLAYLQSGQDFDYPRATAYLRESTALLHALGDSDGLCFALHLQGEMALAAGELAVAAATVQQLVTLARAADYRRHLAMALTALAKIKLEQSEWPAALSASAEGLQLAQTIGDKDRIMAAHCYLGHGQRAVGMLSAALAHYHESLALAQTLANQHFAGEALFGCGAIALALGDPLAAVRFFSATTNRLDNVQPYFKAADRTQLHTFVAQAQAHSDPALFAAAWATGGACTFDDAIRMAQRFCLLHMAG
jgi:tetratricopeptide (TPR) repeat protein